MRPELAATVGQWRDIECECMVKLSNALTVTGVYQCAACSNTNLRYIHTLQHRDDSREIDVGIECARVLSGDYEMPGLLENETKRKERWRIRYRRPGRCVTTVQDIIERTEQGRL